MHLDLTGEARSTRDLMISFVDLSLFAKEASHRPDPVVADTVDAYYERLAVHVERAGGAVVKFIGDGALLVFAPEGADSALGALLELRRDVDDWLAGVGWNSRLNVKVHAGPVVAGGYGPRGAKFFDVIGNTVNVAARLPRPFHVTPQVFRLLSPDGRRALKKHTPPVTYIPVDDRHA